MINDWLRNFDAGLATRAQEILGAHPDGGGTMFRVWAPAAVSVSVVGDWNGWNPGNDAMAPLSGGIWELRLPDVGAGARYKYAIQARDGQIRMKADPYAFQSELRPATASIVSEPGNFRWTDSEWIAGRAKRRLADSPLCVYEVHLGSWRRGAKGEMPSYEQLADTLIPYVVEMGFTHIEMMPVTEYPYDASWGYQCTGYFSPTARYGSPHELMAFIDRCHRAGLGVIMDWAPAHFPKDAHGLYEFDGSCCYEYGDMRLSEHPSWGTRVFDFGRGQVCSFLVSSALFWLEMYHIDGLRVDAVASMLYLDYDRKPGEWQTNIYGGKENLEAVEFLKRLNNAAFAFDENILMVAEESTAWARVTAPVSSGGLGFNLKWNMGWMNDCLEYVRTDPYFRAGNHRALNFSIMYAFSEKYQLTLSHDEVVHMKGSLYNKMPGDKAMKLAGVRVFWAYTLAHPGKKLIFMGAELGQYAEWDFDGELSWWELEDGANRALQDFFRDSNHFYKSRPELWRHDFSELGFKWICPDESMRNTVGFIRLDGEGGELICVCSFCGTENRGFRLGLPSQGEYEIVFSTDEHKFGGSGSLVSGRTIKSEPISRHDLKQSLSLDLPPLTAVFLRKITRQK